VTLTVQYRSHPTVMAFAKEHIYPNLWSAPECTRRQLPEGIGWPQQLLTDRDRRVRARTAPASSLDWQLSPDTWQNTPLPADAVDQGGPAGSPPPLLAPGSQDYLALAIDTATLATDCAPPRPGLPAPGASEAPAPEAAADHPPAPEPTVDTEEPSPETVDWGGEPPDPRPATSTAPLVRNRTPHPLVFIHVDGRESYGPRGHGLQNAAERQAIVSVLAHCASA
jgi:hypothetical protein